MGNRPKWPISAYMASARERQKGRAEDGEGDARSRFPEVENSVMGADGGEYTRALQNALEAEQGNGDEPYQHYRPEDVADELRSLALHQEQADEDRDSDGNDRRR